MHETFRLLFDQVKGDDSHARAKNSRESLLTLPKRVPYIAWHVYQRTLIISHVECLNKTDGKAAGFWLERNQKEVLGNAHYLARTLNEARGLKLDVASPISDLKMGGGQTTSKTFPTWNSFQDRIALLVAFTFPGLLLFVTTCRCLSLLLTNALCCSIVSFQVGEDRVINHLGSSSKKQRIETVL